MHAAWHRPEFIRTDPLRHARMAASPADREIAAFIASGFAWGNVRAIDASLTKAFAVLGSAPARALMEERDPAAWRVRFRAVVHRRIHPSDIAYLCALLGEALRRHGSLEGLWRTVDDGASATIADPARRFLRALGELPVEMPQDRGRTRDGRRLARAVGLAPFGYAAEGAQSPLKRLCLFLRWVARPEDGIDLGLWTAIAPARLVMPLDVHVLRQARLLGLTERKDASMRTALEVTARLREFTPEDPCRYDFALVREGMRRK